jgi:PKD domain
VEDLRFRNHSQSVTSLRGILIGVAIAILFAVPVQAKTGGNGEITFWEDNDVGVAAEAHSFQPAADPKDSSSSSSSVAASQVYVCESRVHPVSLGCAYYQIGFAPADAAPAPVTISAADLGQIAGDRAIALAPNPNLAISPARVGLTGLRSYFWLDEPPQPITATASAGGLTVIAEARPASYVWTFGDDRSKTTVRPGRPWTKRRPGNISHMYETRGRYVLSIEILWSARWRTTTGSWNDLGTFTTSESRDYPVREARTRLVRSRP